MSLSKMSVAPALSPQSDHSHADEGPIFEEGAEERVSARGRRWIKRHADERTALAIAQRCHVSKVLGRILAARNVTLDSCEDFLHPSLRASMPDPLVLVDMEKATKRLADAIIAGEKIGIFGDYDVDGTTAAAILSNYLTEVGARPEIYLPDRFIEGYGPTAAAFEELAQRGVKVIVTVDCGSVSFDPIARAAELGCDVIVLDHHLMTEIPAGVHALINPHRPDDVSGLKALSAAGVTFMAVVALNRALREAGRFQEKGEPDLKKFLDLTALGLICDVMPLKGLTRTLVAVGLQVAGSTGTAGLYKLGEQSGVKWPASAYDFGFLIGPRINAAGRIGHARSAFDLLTTSDEEKRVKLAEELHLLNAERQEIEQRVLEEAMARAEADKSDPNSPLIVAGQNWHPGVIGIVAGRLKDRFDRPTLVVAIDENGVGKGSGRSISGVDLGAAVRLCREQGLLDAGGGHAMAAGLTIQADKLEAFSAALSSALNDEIAAARSELSTSYDEEILISAINRRFFDEIAVVGPFGPGNPEPVFLLRDVIVNNVRVVGKGHLAFDLSSDLGETARAIAFRAEGEPVGAHCRSGERLDVLARLKADDWRGRDAVQLQISDVRAAAV
ncbi:MAG: single-stranded-DNA-specific exonuclease RecJ [Pseudomonadota bacterium]